MGGGAQGERRGRQAAGSRAAHVRRMDTTGDAARAHGGRGRPGEDAPEIPRVPPPEPEAPGRMGQPPGREMPGIPRPEPESPGAPVQTPEAPVGPNMPGE
jgi:hypothetical protein